MNFRISQIRAARTAAPFLFIDEMQDVYKMIDEADNIVIASPIYMGNLTGSLLNWASRLQYFWVSRRIRKVEPISTKYRKGAVVLIVNHGKDNIEPATFSGKNLLMKTRTECCEILQWTDADGANQPLPILNMNKIVKLADSLNPDKKRNLRLLTDNKANKNCFFQKRFDMEKLNCNELLNKITAKFKTEKTIVFVTSVDKKAMAHINDGMAIFFATNRNSEKVMQMRRNPNIVPAVENIKTETATEFFGHPKGHAFFKSEYQKNFPQSSEQYPEKSDDLLI